MKNYEKYADKIKEYNGFNFCRDFVKPHILKSRGCTHTHCDQCKMLQMAWLLEDYEEDRVDWSKVEVDTPILVRDGECEEWERGYFAKFEDGIIYAWNSGRTSWTEDHIRHWNYVKLAESEDE